MTSFAVTLVAGINPALTRPGGIRSYVLGLAKYLATAGTDVTLIGIGPDHPNPGYRFVPIVAKSSTSSVAFHRGLRRYLRRMGPPGGIIHLQRPDDLAPFASVGYGLTGVITIHGDPLPGIRSRHGALTALAYLRLEKRGIAAAKRVLFLDVSGRESFSRRHPKETDKFANTSAGIDLDVFRRTDSTEARIRWKLADGPHLLFAGRFETEKNLSLLVEAVRRSKTVPTLLLAGGGRETERLSNSLRDVPHRFLGVVAHEEMPGLYSAVNATLLTSSREAMPMTCLESLACGTPLVATSTGRLPDLITPGLNGFLATSEPLEFARCIDEVVRNGAAMALDCRKSALRFGWDRVLPVLLREYEEALS